MQKPLIISIILSIVIIGSLAFLFLDDYNNSIPDTVKVGLLFPTSGDLSTSGNENILSTQMAINDFNQYLKNQKASWQLVGYHKDTQTTPELALKIAKEFHADGIDIIIGPKTSSELALIKPYVDQNGLLVFSPSSTAPSLAVKDNIFRLVPDDTHQGSVIANLLEQKDIKAIVMLTRDDIWGNGLSKSITNNYLIDGIHPPKIEIKYSTDEQNYFDIIQNLSNAVDSHLQNYNSDQIAVIVIGFGETADFFKESLRFDNLSSVQWIGTDSNANEKKITDDAESLKFAKKVNFSALQFASESNPIKDELEQRLSDKLGYTPSSYSYSAYDAVWIVGKSILKADSIEPHKIKFEIGQVAASHRGTLSSTELNHAGDLNSGNYNLWGIVNDSWQVIGLIGDSHKQHLVN